ncbi:MOSC domain-containing protein [Halocynthiibacter styelae]|uniref:MOSC domain-containing protein n=1 Tax=Halocynthiibacter styelae TaxID=2761955 RepID=A0A8J7IVG5_9RHOB|nr:MOSC domain-containing protein [Paenihalocynthiibacter styelae]MBI1492295.1 MOSC domain-containing protein [Paenihalocynthiibacter styelae]
MQNHARAGRLDWIGLRPARKADLITPDRTDVTEAGLVGDRHPSPGKRAVTLIQAEHLPVITALCGKPDITPELLRRNLMVSGINLSALRNQILKIGDVTLKITSPCAPCSRMEVILGPGGYNAMRGHGGWCAEVITPGHIRIGDPVTSK